MAFNWLEQFHHDMEKPANYAEKTLAAYKLGMKAKGSIAGVRIVTHAQSCADSCALDPHAVYDPDEAPRLPLPTCPLQSKCLCVYRPVMTYEKK